MGRRPFSLYPLLLLLALQSMGGIYGGICLTLSPSGNIIQMPLSMLDGSPFANFLIPGLILLLLLGLFPSFVVWALIIRPHWVWPDILNVYRGIHWAWTFSLYLGIMLVVWILVEIMFIRYDILQTIFGLWGVGIIIFALLPATMRFYGWKKG